MFENLVEDIQGYKKPLAFGIARVDLGQLNHDKILHATYPVINWNESFGTAAVFIRSLFENGVEVDFNSSEFVAAVTKEFVETALNYFGDELVNEAQGDKHKNIQVLKVLKEIFDDEVMDNYRICFLFEDKAPKSVEAVYLKLYALSTKKVSLRSINLTGAFGI